ncbi:hypothetical protein [Vibrio phage PhiImVa-1]|nr:hypothetical protein [Vibrio phage PhiImVa-1]
MLFLRTHHGLPNNDSGEYLVWYFEPIKQLVYKDIKTVFTVKLSLAERGDTEEWANRYMFGDQAIYLPMVNHATIKNLHL